MFEHGRIYPKHGRDGQGHDDAASQPPRLDESIKVSPSPREWPAEPRRAPLQSRVPDQRQTVRRKEDIGSESLGIQRGARCMTNAMHHNGRRRVPRATASPKAASPPRSSWPARACGSGRTPRGVSQFAKPPLPSSGPHRLCSSHSPTRSRRNWGTQSVEVSSRWAADGELVPLLVSAIYLGLGSWPRPQVAKGGESKSCPAPASSRLGAERC